MEKANNKMTIGRFIFGSIITILIFPAVILFASGNWLWLEGWIFSLWFDAMVLSNVMYLYLKDPELVLQFDTKGPPEVSSCRTIQVSVFSGRTARSDRLPSD